MKYLIPPPTVPYTRPIQPLRRLLLLLILLPVLLHAQEEAVQPNWKSLNQRGYPQWFSDAKLGIFIHWGLYSVPAYAGKEGYAEWFYRGLMVKDSGRCQIMSLYADTTLPVYEQYKALTKHWHAELWNPSEWARLFKEAGAKYVVLVTKHHDGYCLWDSPQQPEWNSVVSGPHRNIVAELTEAVRNEGLTMGFYYSLPEWSNPRHIWMEDPDSAIGDYVDNYMVPQFKELISRYKPSLIFSDGDWQNTPEQLRSVELIDWYYRTVGPDAIVNDRWGKGTLHGFKTPEYSQGISMQSVPWAECRGIGRSFGLNRNEDLDNYLTSTELIQHFCDLVAHGGGLTLNVGPAADGTIPFIQQERLRDLGQWLHVNGEAIYGADEWNVVRTGLKTHENATASLPESSTLDFNWVRNAPLKGMPVDHFTLQWNGEVQIDETGDYLFLVEGDDEVTVQRAASDTLLYYNHAWAENEHCRASLHLTKGTTLPLTVTLREKELETFINLKWSRDGGKTFTPVPAHWRGSAHWRKALRCYTHKGSNLYLIEFERPSAHTVIEYAPHLKPGTKVTLLGTTGTLRWSQDKQRTLTLDLSDLDPAELNALNHAWVFKIADY